jgi:hypothetical protein
MEHKSNWQDWAARWDRRTSLMKVSSPQKIAFILVITEAEAAFLDSSLQGNEKDHG